MLTYLFEIDQWNVLYFESLTEILERHCLVFLSARYVTETANIGEMVRNQYLNFPK